MTAALVAGRLSTLSTQVMRLIAPNAGMMTGPGTNTYLIGTDNIAVLDPGPDDAAHVDAIIAAGDGRITKIVVTHTHRDHSPGATTLARRTGATLYGMAPPPTPENDQGFRADVELAHDDCIVVGEHCTIRAVHTPGHASNHVCYLLEQEGMIFTGDHIMNGSTVVIAPPDGDMSAYLSSLALLKSYAPLTIAPGHGDLLADPDAAVDWIIAHRLQREQKVASKLTTLGAVTIDKLLPAVYDEIDTALLGIAKYSLWAHLLKLEGEQKAVCNDGIWEMKNE